MNYKQLTLNHYSIAVIRKEIISPRVWNRKKKTNQQYILTIHRADTGHTVHSSEHRTLKDCKTVAQAWFKMKHFGGVIIHAYI